MPSFAHGATCKQTLVSYLVCNRRTTLSRSTTRKLRRSNWSLDFTGHSIAWRAKGEVLLSRIGLMVYQYARTLGIVSRYAYISLWVSTWVIPHPLYCDMCQNFGCIYCDMPWWRPDQEAALRGRAGCGSFCSCRLTCWLSRLSTFEWIVASNVQNLSLTLVTCLSVVCFQKR